MFCFFFLTASRRIKSEFGAEDQQYFQNGYYTRGPYRLGYIILLLVLKISKNPAMRSNATPPPANATEMDYNTRTRRVVVNRGRVTGHGQQ